MDQNFKRRKTLHRRALLADSARLRDRLVLAQQDQPQLPPDEPARIRPKRNLLAVTIFRHWAESQKVDACVGDDHLRKFLLEILLSLLRSGLANSRHRIGQRLRRRFQCIDMRDDVLLDRCLRHRSMADRLARKIGARGWRNQCKDRKPDQHHSQCHHNPFT